MSLLQSSSDGTVFYDRCGRVVVPRADSVVRPRQGVFALVCNRDDILLVWQEFAKGVGQLPGGGIEEGETPDQALKREWDEETGLQFSLVKPLKEYRHNRGFYADDKDEFWFYDQTFRLYRLNEPMENEKKWRNSEGDLVGWSSIKELPKMQIAQAHWLAIVALLPEMGELK